MFYTGYDFLDSKPESIVPDDERCKVEQVTHALSLFAPVHYRLLRSSPGPVDTATFHSWMIVGRREKKVIFYGRPDLPPLVELPAILEEAKDRLAAEEHQVFA